ncbi:MAG TPA: Mut7-C RNAse domain-containing protein [Elusimicrobiota bacterium]|nr:Mut7-C RNAse domain-containing protein [Elusimicrobiota bacterium]
MEPRFLVDAMLGKLARWLVLLGYDAAFAGVDGRSDLELLRQAQREGRTFVTKDRRIPEVAGLPVIVLTGKDFEEQLRELALKPDPARLFSRCTDCNVPLASLSREEALPLVPPKVKALDTPFWRCPKCGKLFWNGTHTDRIIATLRRAVPGM